MKKTRKKLKTPKIKRLSKDRTKKKRQSKTLQYIMKQTKQKNLKNPQKFKPKTKS